MVSPVASMTPPAGGDQPPFGTSPATGPTENRGMEMAGLQQLGVVIKALERILPLVGAASDSGKDVLKALNSLSKHVPAGSVTPAAEQNQLQQAQIRSVQAGQQAAQLRQQQAQPGGAAPPQAAAA